MKLVIIALTVSSSWGNGHATIWRGLLKALHQRNHQVVFFEKDVPYYAAHRDLHELPGTELHIYKDWPNIREHVEFHLRTADVAVVTSYCADAQAACELVCSTAKGVKIFYDLDTPVTLLNLRSGNWPDYVPTDGFSQFDLVLSYTGGEALPELKRVLKAKKAMPLYGCADPDSHQPTNPDPQYNSTLSYLGTYAEDRQSKLQELFIKAAHSLPNKRFVLGGSLYPYDFPWCDNIWFVRHVPPPKHSAFYCSSEFTLNITRGAMADMGYCPSGRLFEAAACGVPVISDWWTGLESFFEPGRELVSAYSKDDVVNALEMTESERDRIAAAARRRILEEHTAMHRIIEFENIIECL